MAALSSRRAVHPSKHSMYAREPKSALVEWEEIVMPAPAKDLLDTANGVANGSTLALRTANHEDMEVDTSEQGPSSCLDSSSHSQQCLPSFRCFKLVLRNKQLELESQVHLYEEYPLRPPLYLLKQLREVNLKDKKAAPKVLGLVNELNWLEYEVNVVAVTAALKNVPLEVFAQQMHHLRLCLDEIADQYLLDGSKDLMAQLQAKQKLRGRSRNVASIILPS